MKINTTIDDSAKDLDLGERCVLLLRNLTSRFALGVERMHAIKAAIETSSPEILRLFEISQSYVHKSDEVGASLATAVVELRDALVANRTEADEISSLLNNLIRSIDSQ